MSSTNLPTILVMGATGGIGGALIRELVSDPETGTVKVRAAVRRPDAAAAMQRLGIETAFLDLDGIERLPIEQNKPLLDALTGVDSLFLLTGYTIEMLAQSKAVIDAAKRTGVSHIVHLGAWANDDTTVVHLGWHQMIERYIEWAGFNYTHLRPNVFMQNILNFSLQQDGVIYQFIGDAPVSWIDTDDIAAVAATILRSPHKHHGHTYPLAVERLSVGQVADILSKVVAYHCVMNRVPLMNG